MQFHNVMTLARLKQTKKKKINDSIQNLTDQVLR